MKVEVRRVDNGKQETIYVEAARIAVKAPDHGDYLLTAEVHEGESPLQILLSDGREMAVKSLQLTRSSTYFVKTFKRKGAKPHTVEQHERKKPTSLARYAHKWTPERRQKFSATMAAKRTESPQPPKLISHRETIAAAVARQQQNREDYRSKMSKVMKAYHARKRMAQKVGA